MREKPDEHRHWCDWCGAYWTHGDEDQPECGEEAMRLRPYGDLVCPAHRERQEGL